MIGHGIAGAAQDVDARLSGIANEFDLLPQVTPTNADEAWMEFQASRYRRPPHFTYRPATFDPGHLKSELWAARPESVDDPLLAQLLGAVQIQLDRQLTMLSAIDSSEFLDESLQLYGGVEAELLALAESVLERASGPTPVPGPVLSAEELCELAATEVRRYRDEAPDFGPLPRVSAETLGLLVSHGQLMIGSGVRITSSRADATLQHEVGTHMQGVDCTHAARRGVARPRRTRRTARASPLSRAPGGV